MRKPVKMWALWYDGDRCPVEVHRTRADARVRAMGIWTLRIVRVEIRPARKAKAPKPKRWSLVDSKTFREGSWADPEPQEKKAKEKRRSRAGGSR